MQGRPGSAMTALLSSITITAVSTILASAAVAQNSSASPSQSPQQNTTGGDKACDATAVPTEALAKATFSLQRAFDKMKRKTDATTDLRTTITALTTPAPAKAQGDSLGRAYYLGQAYILLLQEPGIKPIGPRGSYGIATDPVLNVDLLAAADTAFSRVEKGMPACAAELAKWRQQKPWLDALNQAISALNAAQYDTAAVLAKRALIIDRRSPYAYSVLATVANHNKDYATALDMYQHALDDANKDTTYADTRLGTMFMLAKTATQAALDATGPDKVSLTQAAIADWQAVIPLDTEDIRVASGEQNIIRLLKSVGDSSQIAQAYSQIIANPSKYGEQALLNAGTIATQAKKPDDAVKLFAAVLNVNPNQRDALNNLAAAYVVAKQQEKMLPLVAKLVSLDPNNPNSWLLYAYAYTGLLKQTKNPALVKAYTDSLTKYNAKVDHLTTKVTISDFSHGKNLTTMGGSIENLAAIPKSYTIEIDFLDKTGAVVGTQAVNVGPVPPKEKAPFTASVPTAAAVAFRYKPLT